MCIPKCNVKSLQDIFYSLVARLRRLALGGNQRCRGLPSCQEVNTDPYKGLYVSDVGAQL
jgi:hypothetical protein